MGKLQVDFNKNLLNKLKTSIPDGIPHLEFLKCWRGHARFNGELLTHLYFVISVEDIVHHLKFNYKHFYRGNERGAILKFDYIDNQYIFKNILIESKLVDKNDNICEYRFDADLKLDTKYLVQRDKYLVQRDKELCIIKTEKYDDKNIIKVNEQYFLHTPKQFKKLSKILIEKKILKNIDEETNFKYITSSDKDDIYLIIT